VLTSIMNSLRKLKAMVAEPFVGPPCDSLAVLQAAKAPVSDADCRNCANPCDQGICAIKFTQCRLFTLRGIGHEEYPQRFDVDFVSDLLGSAKPYRRQVNLSFIPISEFDLTVHAR
jgi:hypothetical protein